MQWMLGVVKLFCVRLQSKCKLRGKKHLGEQGIPERNKNMTNNPVVFQMCETILSAEVGGEVLSNFGKEKNLKHQRRKDLHVALSSS